MAPLCHTTEFDPLLSLDCAGLEGGPQSCHLATLVLVRQGHFFMGGGSHEGHFHDEEEEGEEPSLDFSSPFAFARHMNTVDWISDQDPSMYYCLTLLLSGKIPKLTFANIPFSQQEEKEWDRRTWML